MPTEHPSTSILFLLKGKEEEEDGLVFCLMQMEFGEGTQPSTVVCKMEAWLEYAHIACTRFCLFGVDLYAQSLLSKKISASEFSRKFIKSALLAGKTLAHMHTPVQL